jgi:hypothetical protein
MAVALLALFVSVGGVGYAAATIGSAQIKNNSVAGKDIRNRTITGRDVKGNALGNKQIKNGDLQAATANNAFSLGGAAASAYLKNGGAAGGALTGSYPSPGFAKTVVPLSLKPTWAALPGYGTPAVWKDGYGVVHLRGALTRNSGTSDNPFDLPPGFRPESFRDVTIEVHSGFGILVFNPNGSVTATPLTAGAAIDDIVNIGEASFEAPG